jgi:hypothetical protein
VLAENARTLVNILLAAVAPEAGEAEARAGADSIGTGAAVQALHTLAVVKVLLATVPGEAKRAGAEVVGHLDALKPSWSLCYVLKLEQVPFLTRSVQLPPFLQGPL